MEQNNSERVDRLHIPGLSIIQNKNYFCYGIDAVLLAHFASQVSVSQFSQTVTPGVNDRAPVIIDLCTGNAIVPVIMSATSSPATRFMAVELQPQIVDLARRSVNLNNLQDKITVLNKDLCKTTEWGIKAGADMVTVNPPYMVPSKGRQSPNKIKMIARQELACTLKDVIESASWLLKDNGRLVMIHRPDRQKEIETLCFQNELYIEELIKIRPQKDQNPSMVVVIAVKNSPVTRKDSSLTIYASPGQYTPEIIKIYNPKRQ